VFEEIERQLIHHKGRFTSRWSYGALYGLYKLNGGSLKAIEFFEEELFPQINKLTPYESMHLIEALSYNTQLTPERKFEIIDQYFKPIIVLHFASSFKYEVKNMLLLFNSMHNMFYYDQEVWDLILESFISRKYIKNIDLLRNIYETLSVIQEGGNFYRDLTPELEHFKSIFEIRPDLKWRYNVEEKRTYSYQELKARREDYPYPNQILEHKFSPDVIIEGIEEVKVIRDEEREREFDKIVKGRYLSMLGGEETVAQAEDEEFLEKYDERVSKGEAQLVDMEAEEDRVPGEGEDETDAQAKERRLIKLKAREGKLATKVQKAVDSKKQYGYLEVDLSKLALEKSQAMTKAKKKKKT